MNNLKPQDTSISFDPRFVGRKYVFEEINELWDIPFGSPRSMLLWGDRNMGKTSVLLNIKEECLDTNVAYFDPRLLGCDREPKHFWIRLAIAVEKATNIVSPPRGDFFSNPPGMVFWYYLENVVRERRPDQKMLLAIDEYEILEEFVDAEYILYQLFDITAHIQNTAFILCGAHETDKLDFKTSKTAMSLKLGFFTKEECIELISLQPLVFTEMAIERIYDLTHGQPWLLRSLCFEICSDKRELVDKGISAPVKVEDVCSIVDGSDFYSRYRYYFTGNWDRLNPGEMTVLKCLASETQGLRLSDIIQKLGTGRSTAASLCVGLLNMYNLIEKTDGRYHVAIELFRRWILQFQS